MLGALILIAVVLVAAVLVYHAGMFAARRASGGAGISVSGASVQAFPGGTFVALTVTNTGSAPGYVSVALYRGGSRVFWAPGAPGLLYQIYANPNIMWVEPPEPLVYSAPLAPGSSFQYGGAWSAPVGPWTTPGTGSAQNVNGQTQQNVIDDMQYWYTGGAPFPNPPVSVPWAEFAIKEIGYMVVTQPTVFYVYIDDGAALGAAPYSPGAFPSETAWLGGTSNPANLISAWYGQPATEHSSGTVQPGTYLVEYDWFQFGGGAYWSLWSNEPVQYYHPVLLYPGQAATMNYTLAAQLPPGSQCTVSAAIATPAGTAVSSATVAAAP